MKSAYVMLAAAAMLASAACNAEKGSDATATNSSAPIKPVAAPKGGDWTKMVTATPEGGYLMGNPNADVNSASFGQTFSVGTGARDAGTGERQIRLGLRFQF